MGNTNPRNHHLLSRHESVLPWRQMATGCGMSLDQPVQLCDAGWVAGLHERRDTAGRYCLGHGGGCHLHTTPLDIPHPTTQPARLSIVREIPAQHDGLLESRRSEQQAGPCIRPSLPKKRTHHDESSPKRLGKKQTCLQMVGTMTRVGGSTRWPHHLLIPAGSDIVFPETVI